MRAVNPPSTIESIELITQLSERLSRAALLPSAIGRMPSAVISVRASSPNNADRPSISHCSAMSVVSSMRMDLPSGPFRSSVSMGLVSPRAVRCPGGF